MDSLLAFHCKGVCPHESCLLSVVRGFRNGAIYGFKVRLPHAFVMTFLFKSGSLRSKLTQIAQMTYEHSRNLALFVALYKSLLCIMRHCRQKEDGINNLVSGFIGGAVMWGTETPVTSQINMYILSRVSVALARVAVAKGWIPAWNWGYMLYASTIWALVMYLFDYQKGSLQSSLTSSMTYLYTESNEWPRDADSFVDWFWRS